MEINDNEQIIDSDFEYSDIQDYIEYQTYQNEEYSSLDEQEEEIDQELIDELILDQQEEIGDNNEQENQIVEVEHIDFSSLEYIQLNVSVDSEYTDTQFLSLQYIVEGSIVNKDIFFSVIVLEVTYKQYFSDEILQNFSNSNNCIIVFEDLCNNEVNSYLTKYILVGLKEKYSIDLQENIKVYLNLYLFYSLKDLTVAFSPFIMIPYYNGDRKGLSQIRIIKGKIELTDTTYSKTILFIVKIYDLCGLESGGLKKMALSCGLQIEEKSSLDDYKEYMDKAIQEKPNIFLSYSLNDCYLLLKILDLKIQTYNSILKDVFNINEPEVLFSRKTIPLTVGSIVNQIWMKYFKFRILKNDSVLLVSTIKQSILNQLSPAYQTNKEMLSYIEKAKSLNELQSLLYTQKSFLLPNNSLLNTKTNISQFISPNSTVYKFYQFSSSKYLTESSFNETRIYLTLIAGGRTINERPLEYHIDYGADIDISGAYGNVMRKIIFPIGKPRILSYNYNETNKITLGSFMQKYLHKIYDGLFKVVISGKLTFQQDLILSKAISKKTLERRFFMFNPEQVNTYKMTSDLILLRREIRNGVITKPIWDILTKVCTNQEFKEIKNLEVETAMFWLVEDKVDSIEELCNSYCTTPSSSKYNYSKMNLTSNQNYKWFSLPMGNVIEPLTEQRKIFKNKMDPYSQAFQNSLKTVINTSYGVIASAFFDINNVMVTDLITSTVRSQVWLMAKSLNLYLTITDGGPYSLQNVSFHRTNKKIGLDSLSSYYKYSKNRFIKNGPLGDIDWKQKFNQNIDISLEYKDQLDTLAKNHIEKFWSIYNISIDFEVEHKLQNIYIKGCYMGKSNYAFLNYNSSTNKYDSPLYKIRGVKIDLKNTLQISPIFYLLEFMLLNDMNINDKFIIANDRYYYHQTLLKLPQWRKSLVKIKGKKVSNQ